MMSRSRNDAQRRRVFARYIRARQRLTLDHLVAFEEVERRRAASEGRSLLDWYGSRG